MFYFFARSRVLLQDPRYGRNSELPGEDPFLTGSYAVAMTGGMQPLQAGTGPLAGKLYQKMMAYVKHYTAYVLNRAHVIRRSTAVSKIR